MFATNCHATISHIKPAADSVTGKRKREVISSSYVAARIESGGGNEASRGETFTQDSRAVLKLPRTTDVTDSCDVEVEHRSPHLSGMWRIQWLEHDRGAIFAHLARAGRP